MDICPNEDLLSSSVANTRASQRFDEGGFLERLVARHLGDALWSLEAQTAGRGSVVSREGDDRLEASLAVAQAEMSERGASGTAGVSIPCDAPQGPRLLAPTWPEAGASGAAERTAPPSVRFHIS